MSDEDKNPLLIFMDIVANGIHAVTSKLKGLISRIRKSREDKNARPAD